KNNKTQSYNSYKLVKSFADSCFYFSFHSIEFFIHSFFKRINLCIKLSFNQLQIALSNKTVKGLFLRGFHFCSKNFRDFLIKSCFMEFFRKLKCINRKCSHFLGKIGLINDNLTECYSLIVKNTSRLLTAILLLLSITFSNVSNSFAT